MSKKEGRVLWTCWTIPLCAHVLRYRCCFRSVMKSTLRKLSRRRRETAPHLSTMVGCAFLTIPEQDLLELNQFDFYEGRFSLRIRELINRHFETAIVAYLFPLLDNMIQYFRGRTVLRAFGLTSKTSNYYDFAKSVCDPGFTRRISENLDRFWFGQAYPKS